MGQSTASSHRSRCVLLRILLWGMVGGLWGTLSPLNAATPGSITREYDVKAAALYNIIAFTDWPEAAFATSDSPLVIAVFGRGQIGPALAEMIHDESWRGRRLVLRANPTVSEAKSAHVVFISRTEQLRWPFLRAQLAGRPILTVSDAGDFARQAGMVQFAIDRNKLKLTVNPAAAKAARLQISSQVLQLAEVVGAKSE